MATLAEVLRQAGYVTPQGQVTGPRTDLAQKLKSYVMNIPQNAAQNLANQRADIDAALTMGQGGIQIGDREAFARQMAEVPNLMGLTAYHGTPHTIKGKFDISKVGTGEGAQAYGHGMYFAESPTVAEFYKNTLKTKDQDIINNAIERLVYVNNKDTSKIADALKMEGFNLKKITPELENSIKKIVQATDATTNTVSKAGINEYANLSKLVPEQGNLYKVDIPDEYIPNMLDWDKPLREQPQILKNLGIDIKEYDKIKAQRQAMPEKFDIDIPEELAQYEIARKLDKQLNEMGVDKSGRYFYEDLIKKYGTQKAISEALAEKGIKGVQYFDAGSRGKAAERTRNYVVFEPSEVKILEQNSKPMTRKEIIEQELEKVAK